MTPRRWMILAVGLILVGAAVALLASGRTWLSATWVSSNFPAVRIQRSGGEVAPLVRAAGFVALAGVVAMLATRRRGRLVIGAAVALAGAAVVVGCAIFWAGPLADYAVLSNEAGGPALSAHATHLSTSGWSYAAAAGGVLVAAGGVVTLLRSGQWPAMGTKYDAPTAPERRVTSDPWAALDRGDDPTTKA